MYNKFLYAGGEVPDPRNLAAICIAALRSSSLTAQQNEAEPVKRYPLGFKHDRDLAAKYATEIMERFAKVELDDGLLGYLKFCNTYMVKDPNRDQRELPEEGEDASDFYHDNEHEYRMTLSPESPWVGKRPKAPPKYPWKGEWEDSEVQSEYSEGECFHEWEFGETELIYNEGGDNASEYRDSVDRNQPPEETEATDSSIKKMVDLRQELEGLTAGDLHEIEFPGGDGLHLTEPHEGVQTDFATGLLESVSMEVDTGREL